jgi:hypothetical protein
MKTTRAKANFPTALALVTGGTPDQLQIKRSLRTSTASPCRFIIRSLLLSFYASAMPSGSSWTIANGGTVFALKVIW